MIYIIAIVPGMSDSALTELSANFLENRVRAHHDDVYAAWHGRDWGAFVKLWTGKDRSSSNGHQELSVIVRC